MAEAEELLMYHMLRFVTRGSFGFMHRVGKRIANEKATTRDPISDLIDLNSIGTVRCSRRYSGSGVE